MFGTPAEVFSKAKELQELSLDVPAATRMMLSLEKEGIPVTSGIYNLEEAAKEIVRLKKEGTAHAQ
jgi:energy-coupling factor transport system ATP-binding protein